MNLVTYSHINHICFVYEDQLFLILRWYTFIKFHGYIRLNWPITAVLKLSDTNKKNIEYTLNTIECVLLMTAFEPNNNRLNIF